MKINGIKSERVEIEITEEQRKQLAIGYIEERFGVRNDWDHDVTGNRLTEEVEVHTSHSWDETVTRLEKPSSMQVDALRFLHILSGRAVWVAAPIPIKIDS